MTQIKSVPFAARIQAFRLGEAIAAFNPLTDDWQVSGQKGSRLPYLCDTWAQASKMLQTINHYNLTSEIKKFRSQPKSQYQRYDYLGRVDLV